MKAGQRNASDMKDVHSGVLERRMAQNRNRFPITARNDAAVKKEASGLLSETTASVPAAAGQAL